MGICRGEKKRDHGIVGNEKAAAQRGAAPAGAAAACGRWQRGPPEASPGCAGGGGEGAPRSHSLEQGRLMFIAEPPLLAGTVCMPEKSF